MAAAKRLDRSGASFGSFVSMFDGFSTTDVFSVADAFALGEGLSVVCAFAPVEDFTVVPALLDDFPFAGALGFVAALVPFADVAPLLAVVLGVVVFSGLALATAADAVAESATGAGAVSGFTAGAHAQAMTIAISGLRA